jgi:TolB-like protein
LHQRKVVQWGALYATGSWGFLQGLGSIGELFDWPRELTRVLVIALLVGFPVVLVVSWYHGDRGAQRVTGAELTLVTLLLLLGGALFWLYQHSLSRSEADGKRALSPTGPVRGDDPVMIAVLPFVNRSDRTDGAHLADGVQDDILTELARTGEFRVVARTSVEQFRGSRLSTRDIAARLGVTALLEGGVQLSGDRVRVTVQLIDVTRDVHLWAEAFDRDLSSMDVLGVQAEVAKAVAGALKSILIKRELRLVEGESISQEPFPAHRGRGRVPLQLKEAGD